MPLWLYYLKNIQKLSFFDFVLARDGAMGLVKFFTEFPEPQGIQTKILIEKSHYRLIPVCWKENVLLYEHQRKSMEFDHSSTILVASGHEYIVSKEDIASCVERINTEIKPERLLVFLTNLKIQGLESARQGESYLGHLVASLCSNFGHQIDFVSEKDLINTNLNRKTYIHLNPVKMMYTESFIDHLLCSKGCTSLTFPISNELSKLIRIADNDYICTEIEWPSDYANIRVKVEAIPSEHLIELLANDGARNTIPVFFNSELYSFVRWVNSI